MNLYIFLTWSTFVLIIVALIVHFYYSKMSAEKKTFLKLESFAVEHNSTITSYDHWDKTIIGIDNRENINRLFFIRTTIKNEFRTVIHLTDVLQIRLEKVTRTVQLENVNVVVIDKIDLVFSFYNPKKPPVALEFYNSDYDSLTLTGELQLAEKWEGMVKSIHNSNMNRQIAGKQTAITDPNKLVVPGTKTQKNIKNLRRKVKYEFD